MKIVFIDFETTGLNPQGGAKIVEFGALKIDEQGHKYSYQRLVHPGHSIPAPAQAVHNIDDYMVEDAPYVDEVIPDFLSFLSGSCICGYNIDFDLGFLEPYVQGSFFRENLFIDILSMARYCFPEMERFSLNNVCAKLGLDFPEQHRALQDSIVSGEVFFKCLDALKNKKEKTDHRSLSKRFGSRIVKKHETTV